ncbi:MAG TPA: phenylalanine--tRNA ligase subunit beta, partial [Clostridia bacterium]
YGIAREIAALVNRPLKSVQLFDSSAYASLPKVAVDVVDTEHTYRYSSVKVDNINVKVSPVNMRIRLYYCGIRSINLLADMTNYVMLELGQPMHAFDSSIVDRIEVRRFEKPFEFETLDNCIRKIDEKMLMITCNNKPIAIAGIMGGHNSEITDHTTSVLFESANFDGINIRESTAKLGLRTDASVRYEKILDPELTLTAIKRILYLLSNIDKDIKIVTCVTDAYIKGFPEVKLTFDKAYIDRYSGIDISHDRIANTLKALGFLVKNEGDSFEVEVPSWRRTKDVTIKADIIEEVTRIYGYDNFEITATRSLLAPVKNSTERVDEYNIKNLLVDKFCLNEVHTYLWCDAKKFKEIGLELENNVKTINSISTDLTVLRNSMIPSLLSVINENKYFSNEFGIFEIARVVDGTKENGYCNERKKLGIVLFNKKDSEENAFFSLKNIIDSIGLTVKNTKFSFENPESVVHSWQHPINTANILYNGEVIGFISIIHPTVQKKIDKKAQIICAELDMGLISKHEATNIQYKEQSKFPNIEFDLSIVVDKDTKFIKISEIIDNHPYEFLTGYRLISVYTGESLKGMKSITIRFNFSSNERTLSMEEVQEAINKYISLFEAKGFHVKTD